MKPKKILLLALVSGLITTMIFYLFVNQSKPNASEKLPMVSVATVNQDITENQQITKENITMVEVPEAQVHAQAVKDKEAIIGKFTTAPIKAGEVVMMHRILQEEEAASYISKKVQGGYRAVSISVDFVKSVSNLVEPGDMVDIVLTKGQEGEERAGVRTEVVLDEVKVLAVGQRMVERKKGETPAEYMAVTLELMQEDAVRLIDASGQGSLQLVLHSKLLPADEAAEAEEETEVHVEEAATLTSASQVVALPPNSLIRSEPELSAPVIDVVAGGTSLEYLDEKETDDEDRIWFLVETPDKKQGWISSRIVKHESE
jgi:pilus assembly protein CpaB